MLLRTAAHWRLRYFHMKNNSLATSWAFPFIFSFWQALVAIGSAKTLAKSSKIAPSGAYGSEMTSSANATSVAAPTLNSPET